jgi:hypothetical protein
VFAGFAGVEVFMHVHAVPLLQSVTMTGHMDAVKKTKFHMFNAARNFRLYSRTFDL